MQSVKTTQNQYYREYSCTIVMPINTDKPEANVIDEMIALTTLIQDIPTHDKRALIYVDHRANMAHEWQHSS